jgi:hypothetical protein
MKTGRCPDCRGKGWVWRGAYETEGNIYIGLGLILMAIFAILGDADRATVSLFLVLCGGVCFLAPPIERFCSTCEGKGKVKS